jgi:UDP-N-acetylglucosamine--N-acetylmuramyl-(pentapeptide) pyrophosphoryl-undecaprenol N-acetylglucosamine transferase
MSSRHFVLAAGGTGGHMVPAAALAAELTRRGHRVALVSDPRGTRFPGLLDGIQTHVIPAGRFQVGRPQGWAAAVRDMWRGRAMTRELIRTFKPAAVVGFGGYPAFPALLAAFAEGVPTAIHEQNAVLGRVNRLVARRVDAIATSYTTTQRLAAALAGKTRLVGNPVREAVLALRERPFPLLEEDGIFRILVTGGSQGASILSKVVPDGLAMLPVAFRRRLQVTHQARIEDIDAARAHYAQHQIAADLATYLPDMPEELAWAHLVIARAGASTIAELTAAGRPAILVPLPSATDDHQTANAREISEAGGARTIAQADFTPVELAKQMQRLGLDPAALENAAGRARGVGRARAVADLADLVEGLGAPPARLPVAIPPARQAALA